MSGNIFKGRVWEEVAEERARKIAKDKGQPEELWELCLGEANQSMLDELSKPEKA